MAETDDDDLNWLQEDEPAAATVPVAALRPWRLLIVDDEADIHTVTRMALHRVTYKEREIEILSAYSGAEGYAVLAREPDIALVLLDVVMETEDAGLRLARRIREELHNHLVRIVLRTGQPGQAPEQQVILEFDINDYKGKTELTVQKLFTTVVTSLRGYEGLQTIEKNRQGLIKILEATSDLYHIRSLRELACGVLTQVGAILNFGTEGVLCVMQDQDASAPGTAPFVMAATGSSLRVQEEETLPADHPWAQAIGQVFRDKQSLFGTTLDVLYIDTAHGHQFAVAFSPPWPLGEVEHSLLKVFCDRIAAAFDNLHMFALLKSTQEATVMALADLAESRDPTFIGHVDRVNRLTQAIVQELLTAGKFADELTPTFVSLIGLASVLHDVGKVATPDTVLLKPARHTLEERKIMEQHARLGELVLARAAGMVEGISSLSIGAQIAGSHHEHFDGTGYPRGLKGQEIALAARIVAAADVFDALLHLRPYKNAWPLDQVLVYMRSQRGLQFDPDVIDALLTFLERAQPDWIIAHTPDDDGL